MSQLRREKQEFNLLPFLFFSGPQQIEHKIHWEVHMKAFTEPSATVQYERKLDKGFRFLTRNIFSWERTFFYSVADLNAIPRLKILSQVVRLLSRVRLL